MSNMILINHQNSGSEFLHAISDCSQKTEFHKELWWFLAAILLLNAPLFIGLPLPGLMFFPDAIANGDWWRLATHPFVHVSWYHLLLDATAFLVLYHGLIQKQLRVRLSYVAATGAGSLLAALWAAPTIGQLGFCGLSGVAHGLMAIAALEWMVIHQKDKLIFRLGVLSFIIVTAKCFWEAATSQALAGFLHFSLMGTPIVVCHAGGVVGGVAAFALRSFWREKETVTGKHFSNSLKDFSSDKRIHR